MENRYRKVRLSQNRPLGETAKLLGVSQPTLSSWEAGRKSPSFDNLIAMAELYKVSVDYLLGRDFEYGQDAIKPIQVSSLPFYHGKPVWVKDYGWALVNSIDSVLVFTDDSKLSFLDAPEAYLIPLAFTEGTIPTENSLKANEIKEFESVWVEPISIDVHLRTELRGWYKVKSEYVENTRGNRFFLDSYSTTWLAFKNII